MTSLAMYEIIELVTKARTKKEKVQILKDNYSPQLHEVLSYAYRPEIEWMLPQDSDPPYTELADDPAAAKKAFYANARQLYMFVRHSDPRARSNQMKPYQREMRFIEMLGRLHPKDAKMLLWVKNQKLPKGLTPEIIEEAYGKL